MKVVPASTAIVITLVVAMAIPIQLAAQERSAVAPQHHRYAVTSLGTLGGTFSQAFGINHKGEVVGYSTTPDDAAVHAFLWQKGVMTDLGTLAGSDTLPYSQPNSINDLGQVAGLSETSDPDPLGENFCGDSLVCLPVVWKAGVATALPTLGGTNGNVLGINNRGEEAGTAENSSADPTCIAPQVLSFKPVIWKNGSVRELPTIGGDPDGFAVAINDKGQAVGITTDCGFTTPGHSVFWYNGRAIDMNASGQTSFGPNDINNSGQVTGSAFDPTTGAVVASVWQRGLVMYLGALPEDVESHGNSVNDKGTVVGQSCSASGFPDCSVFLWQNGVMSDLNLLAGGDSNIVLVDSGGINSRGEIVGLGIHRGTGAFLAFLAIPCDQQHADNQGCNGEATAPIGIRITPKIAVPEVLRRHGQRQSGIRGLIHRPMNGPSR